MSRLWEGGFWTTQTLSGVGPKRRLVDCNVEEIRAQFKMKASSAMAFDASGVNKAQARQLVLDLFSFNRYPHKMSILTMPGANWCFETALILEREGWSNFSSGSRPARTRIYALENDRAIYYDALLKVPGLHHPRNVIKDKGRTTYAERVLSYNSIKRYVFGDVDDYIQIGQTYTCAWLDYFGPMTLERFSRVKAFFIENVRGTLVFTNLKGRWKPPVSSALSRYDSYEAWLREEFSGYRVEHYLEYYDTSQMVQFAVSKIRPHAPEYPRVDHDDAGASGQTVVGQTQTCG